MSRPLSLASHLLGQKDPRACVHAHISAPCSPAVRRLLVKKVLICILLLTWRDTRRATERESMCVNQCNGARTSVALKREQTCGGQDEFFFFYFFFPVFMQRETAIQHICHCRQHNCSSSQTERREWWRELKEKKDDRDEEWQSRWHTTLGVWLFLCLIPVICGCVCVCVCLEAVLIGC